MFQEFKKFLIGGNLIELAVAFIFGAAFSTVVKSFVENIVMPPVGMLLGKVDFSQLFISLNGDSYATLAAAKLAGAPTINYGTFVNDIISFTILGFVMFMAIKAYSKIKEATPEVVAEPEENILLLREIRDSLKK
jgi:large conductance mechanosensitive channel